MASDIGGSKLLGVQTARGIAALLVVVYHGARMIALPQYVGYIPLGNFFNFGHAGVDFFFVLSGFIIYYVHRSDIGRPHNILRYAWRRLTRIYPIYWIITAAIVFLVIIAGKTDILSPSYLVSSLLLLPQGRNPLLDVAWTLEHEMLFYLVFAVAILEARIGTVLFAAWGLLIAARLVDMAPDLPLVNFIASPYHSQFFMGIGAAHMVRNSNVSAPRSLALFGVIAFLSVAMIENAGAIRWAGPLSQILYGAAASFIVLGLAVSELRGRLTVGHIGAFLGAASYSIYLLHTIVIGIAARSLMNLHIVKAIPGWTILIIVSIAAVSAAGMLYYFVERPLLAWFHRIGRTYIYARHSVSRLADANT